MKDLSQIFPYPTLKESHTNHHFKFYEKTQRNRNS